MSKQLWTVASLMILVAGLCLLSGCVPYHAPVKPPQGLLFNGYKAPLTVNFDQTPTGPGVIKVSKSHTAYFHDILITGWLDFAWDSVSVEKIAREGGIKEISYVDYEAFNILFGLYGEFTLNVYGK